MAIDFDYILSKTADIVTIVSAVGVGYGAVRYSIRNRETTVTGTNIYKAQKMKIEIYNLNNAITNQNDIKKISRKVKK